MRPAGGLWNPRPDSLWAGYLPSRITWLLRL